MARTVKLQTDNSGTKVNSGTKLALLFGVGYTARALIPELKSAGYRIIGTTRSDEKAKSLAAKLGIGMVVFDGQLNAGLKEALSKADFVLSSIPPTDQGDPVIRAMNGNFSSFAPHATWTGYFSATSVYGDRDGQWVYEDELLKPVTKRGWHRLKAEMAWLESGAPVHVFRLAGIYGPEVGGLSRHPFDRLRAGKARAVIKPGHVVNRIYVTDIASAVMASVKKPNPVYIYNLSDGEPSPPQDVINYAADLIGVSRPPQYDYITADISKMARSFYTANKRVANDRAKRELNWRPKFPNYREGLKAIVTSEAQQNA